MEELTEEDDSDETPTTEGETNPTEGDENEDSSDDNETPVTDPEENPAEDPDAAPVEEPTEEVMEPTLPTEEIEMPEPAGETEEPEKFENGIIVNGVEIMAEDPAAELVTLTFDGFEALRQRAKITVTIGDSNKPLRTSAIKVSKESTVSIAIEEIVGYKVEKVKQGDKELTKGASYTLDTSKDATITVETYTAYTLTLADAEDSNATGQGILLDSALKDAVGSESNLTVANNATVEVKNAADQALKFTLTGKEKDDTRTKVYYSVIKDANEDDMEEILPVKEDKTEGTTTTKVDTYTVPASVISDLDGMITIHLTAEAAKTVKAADDTDTDVVIKVKAAEKDEEGNDKYDTLPDAGQKVLSGEKFTFKVELKSDVTNREITKVEYVVGKDKDAKSEEVKPNTDKVYEITVTEDTQIKVTTELVAAAVIPFQFTLKDSEEGSATAAITSITTKKDDTETTYGGKGGTAINTYPGLETSQALEAGKIVRVQKPGDGAEITALEVTVTPVKANGYALKSLGDGDELDETTGARVYKFAKTAASGVSAFEPENAVNSIEVTTEVIKTEASAAKYFNIKRVTPASGESENVKLVINAADKDSTAATDKIRETEKTTSDGLYMVPGGNDKVSFTIEVADGWEIANLEAIKTALSGKGSITLTNTAADGKETYTVELRAAALGEQNNATDLGTLAQKEKTLSAAIVSPKAGDDTTDPYTDFTQASFTYTAPKAAGATEAPKPMAVPSDATIPYKSTLNLKLVAKHGHKFTSVTYTMGGENGTATAVIKNEPVGEELVNTATLEIPAITGNVEITVAVDEAAYKLEKLKEVTPTTAPEYVEEDDRYIVSHEGSYVVNVTKGGESVPAKNLTAVIKNGETKVKQNKIPVKEGGLRIDLANKGLAGKDITVEMSVRGESAPVGVYKLTVANETTEISVNGGAVISQPIDRTVSYPITTNEGGVVADGTLTASGEGAAIIESAEVKNGRLIITTSAVAKDTLTDANDKAKEAVLTLKAADNNDVTAEVKVTATSFFDKDKAPSVSAIANGVADTVINVELSADEVVGETKNSDLATGSLWYKVTATPKASYEDKNLKDADVAGKVKGVTQYVRLEEGKAALKVSNAKLGAGIAWDYEISAQVVYSVNENKPNTDTPSTYVEVSKGNNDDKADTEKESVATITPQFTAALKLKKGKGASALYTGQKLANTTKESDLVIATADFSKDKGFKATYQITDDIKDLTDTSGQDLKFAVNAKNEIIVTEVSKAAKLGKHTIQVTATADETDNHEMYASRATIVVNVVKGINDISIELPSTSIYKDTSVNKAVTASPKISYNESGSIWSYDAKGNRTLKGNSPKKKTVEWAIAGVPENEHNEASELPISDKINSSVSVNPKNGKITVDKSFAESSHAADNRFRIKAIAKDFDGNETVGYSPVLEVTNRKADISKLVIARENKESGKLTGYTVVKVQSSNDEVLASDIAECSVYAMAADTPVAEKTYLTKEWNAFKAVSPSVLSFATNNKKLVEVNNNGRLDVKGAGKKVTITVTAKDGSKKNVNKWPLTLKYTELSDLTLEIKAASTVSGLASAAAIAVKDGAKANTKEGDIKDITGSAWLRVQVKGKDASGKVVDANNYSNYSLKVSGGKLVSNDYANHKTLVTASKSVKLTLTDNAAKPKKITTTYNLTNTAYTVDNNAPKVKVTGSLYEYAKLTEQNKSVKFNVVNADKSIPKAVKVEVDWSTRTEKNEKALEAISNAINSGTTGKANIFNIKQDDKDGNKGDMYLTFSGEEYRSFPVGSYKLKVTAMNGEKAESKPATVTLKVVKNKAFTFKLPTTYSINKLGAAPLDAKTNLKGDERPVITNVKLYNANDKGYSNNFTRFFTVESNDAGSDVKTGGYSLKATELLWAAKEGKAGEEITLSDGTKVKVPEFRDKIDLTGYLEYSVKPNVGYFKGVENTVRTETIKITVKLVDDNKAAYKYTPNKPDMAVKGTGTTPINIKIGNSFVKVGYAMLDADPKAKTAEELELDNSGKKQGVNDKGQVVLKLVKDKELKDKKSYTASLKIVPVNSSYFKEVEGAEWKAVSAQADEPTTPTTPTEPEVKPSRQDLIQKYGIAVKVTVKGALEPKNLTPDPVIKDETTQKPDDTKTPDELAAEALTEWVEKVNTEKPVWLRNVEEATTTPAPTADGTATTLNELQERVLAEAKSAVTKANVTGNTEVAYKDTPTYTAAGEAVGSVAGTLTVGEKEVAFDFKIPKEAISLGEAKTAVEGIVTNDKKIEGVTIKTDSDVNTVKTDILNAAKKAIGNVETYYKITSSEISEIPSSGDLTVTLTITSTDTNALPKSDTVSLELTVDKTQS